jgi:hypothetical protein
MRASILTIAAVLGLGCRPAAPAAPSPPPSAPRAGTTGTPGIDIDTGAEPTAPPATGLPHTCTMELEVLVPSASGHGSSRASFDTAKQAAWTQACVELRRSVDLDCRDRERVAIVSERSSSMFAPSESGDSMEAHWEYDVTLGARRIAEGFGDAPVDWEACQRARDHACEQLVGGPCPERGMRVISVDGKPPSAAAVEPAPKAPASRETI